MITSFFASKRLFLILSAIICLESLQAQKKTEKNFSAIFEKYGTRGCFVLYDPAENNYITYNSAYCDTGYIPASTFKIPNSLIALEEGLLADENQVIKWDGQKWPVEAWNSDQTLRTAMKYSCIWVYIGFAEQLGIEKYRDYLYSFDYGNKNPGGPPTKFWLSGPFRISANQQIEFLRKFYNYDLPVSPRSVDIVKDIIILEKSDKYKLSGKTGGSNYDDKNDIMWLVGYLEKGNKTYFYAMNFLTGKNNNARKARLEITKDILKELQFIE